MVCACVVGVVGITGSPLHIYIQLVVIGGRRQQLETVIYLFIYLYNIREFENRRRE
jgi:hypothetical protein